MRKFKLEQVNSAPFRGLDGTVIFHDGTDMTHHILLERVDGLGVPQSSVQTQQAPFQIGATPIRVNFGPRTISLECAIIIDAKTEAGKAAIEAVKRDLGNKFSPVGMGYVPDTSLTNSNYSTVTAKLSYAQDGTNYDRFIDCIPSLCPFPDRSPRDGFQRFRLNLFCPDPTWYGVEQESTMDSVPLAGIADFRNLAWSEPLGLFVVISASHYPWISYDGVYWTEQTSGLSGSSGGELVWSDELMLFCLLRGDGTIYTSPDGITWTLRTTFGATTWTALAWSPELNLFCACSASTAVKTSPDGINWTSRTSASGATVSSIVWSPELMIFCSVVSGSTVVQTSPDGINWTLRTGASALGMAKLAWSAKTSLFVGSVYNSDKVQTSPDGITWTLRTCAANSTWTGIAWSSELELFCIIADSSTSIQTSPDGINWTIRTGISSGTGLNIVWASGLGAFCATLSGGGTEYPQLSYDGVYWFRISASDYVKVIENQGDIPTGFFVDIPILGGETSKVIAIGDNFLWSGTGTPPSDHNLVFSTEGLKKGIVTVSTHFNNMDIVQFGVSKFEKYRQGTFFNLYVSGSITNNIYVRNTGTSAGAPTIRWKNRYLGV